MNKFPHGAVVAFLDEVRLSVQRSFQGKGLIKLRENSFTFALVSRWHRLMLGICSAVGVSHVYGQDLSLTVAAYPEVEAVIQTSLLEWKQRHPLVNTKVLKRNFLEHHSAMSSAALVLVDQPDVMVIDSKYIDRFVASSGLENLSQAPYNANSLQPRFVPYAMDQATASSGAVMALPAAIGPGTLLYRADVLKKVGVTEAELTRSWDSYVAVGAKVKASTGAYLIAHARDLKDVVIRTDLKPSEGLYFDHEGNPAVDSQRFVRAFELARQVREQWLDGRIKVRSNEWLEGFKKGSITTQMSGAWLAGSLINWLAPTATGQWQATNLPEQAWMAWGGTFYAIPKGAKNKSLAWEFIRSMTLDPNVQLNAFKAHDVFPALTEVHRDQYFEQPIVFLGGQAARKLWRHAATQIKATKPHQFDSMAEEIVNEELDRVLDQGKDIRRALADARASIERQVGPPAWQR